MKIIFKSSKIFNYLTKKHFYFTQNGRLDQPKDIPGLGLCPFDPALNTTAVYAGKFYI